MDVGFRVSHGKDPLRDQTLNKNCQTCSTNVKSSKEHVVRKPFFLFSFFPFFLFSFFNFLIFLSSWLLALGSWPLDKLLTA